MQADSPGFVGAERCSTCHTREASLWRQSQHAKAMQHASEDTVLGNFDNAGFDYFGTRSTFYRRDGKFFVRTDGSDGKLADFEISHVFGVSPLQQYLIAFPDGRLQALSVAWDTRPESAGGQRWFHLYPDTPIRAGDPLHWTRREQNWNWMCAECHSTKLERSAGHRWRHPVHARHRRPRRYRLHHRRQYSMAHHPGHPGRQLCPRPGRGCQRSDCAYWPRPATRAWLPSRHRQGTHRDDRLLEVKVRRVHHDRIRRDGEG
jgi:hypothetical protein